MVASPGKIPPMSRFHRRYLHYFGILVLLFYANTSFDEWSYFKCTLFVTVGSELLPSAPGRDQERSKARRRPETDVEMSKATPSHDDRLSCLQIKRRENVMCHAVAMITVKPSQGSQLRPYCCHVKNDALSTLTIAAILLPWQQQRRLNDLGRSRKIIMATMFIFLLRPILQLLLLHVTHLIRDVIGIRGC